MEKTDNQSGMGFQCYKILDSCLHTALRNRHILPLKEHGGWVALLHRNRMFDCNHHIPCMNSSLPDNGAFGKHETPAGVGIALHRRAADLQ